MPHLLTSCRLYPHAQSCILSGFQEKRKEVRKERERRKERGREGVRSGTGFPEGVTASHTGSCFSVAAMKLAEATRRSRGVFWLSVQITVSHVRKCDRNLRQPVTLNPESRIRDRRTQACWCSTVQSTILVLVGNFPTHSPYQYDQSCTDTLISQVILDSIKTTANTNHPIWFIRCL